MTTWNVYTGTGAYTITVEDTIHLATAIRRRYAATIRDPFEVRLDLDGDMEPTGGGVVLAADSWRVLDRLRVTRTGQLRRTA